MIHTKKFILYIVAMIIIGALVGRMWSDVGLWWSIVVLLAYSALGLIDNRRVLRRFRRYPGARRLRAVIVVLITFFAVSAVFTKHIPYFIVLALLAVEYLYRDKAESEAKNKK